MLPTTLKIRYDGKKIKIKSDIDQDIVKAFEKENLLENARNLRRLLIEVYVDNPLDYKNYIERLFKEMIANIATDSGITDLYVLLEPEEVATSFFMNLGARKATIAMRPSINEFQSIATIINKVKRELRGNGGLVIKTDSNHALKYFSDKVKEVRMSEDLLELYFDDEGVKLISNVLEIFTQATSLRLLSKSDRVTISVRQKPLEMIDIRGLSRIDSSSLIEFLRELRSLRNKVCNLYIETSSYMESLNKLLISVLREIDSPSCLDIIMLQENKEFDLKLMHESGIFRIVFNQNLLDSVISQIRNIAEVIDRVLRNNIFIDVWVYRDKVRYRILPKEEESEASMSDWIRKIESAIAEILRIRGMT